MPLLKYLVPSNDQDRRPRLHTGHDVLWSAAVSRPQLDTMSIVVSQTRPGTLCWFREVPFRRVFLILFTPATNTQDEPSHPSAGARLTSSVLPLPITPSYLVYTLLNRYAVCSLLLPISTLPSFMLFRSASAVASLTSGRNRLALPLFSHRPPPSVELIIYARIFTSSPLFPPPPRSAPSSMPSISSFPSPSSSPSSPPSSSPSSSPFSCFFFLSSLLSIPSPSRRSPSSLRRLPPFWFPGSGG